VLISAVTQGWSLPQVARWLRLGGPADPTPPLSVEINALRHVDGEIVDYTVPATAAIAGTLLRDLARPDGMVVTLVVRGRQVVIPRGATALEPGDHVFVALRSAVKPLIDRLFAPDPAAVPLPEGAALSFPAYTTLAQLQRFFVLPDPLIGSQPGDTLGELLRRQGARRQLQLGPLALTALEPVPADDGSEVVRVTI
jgi:potassium/hydrogen antiporter